MHKNVLTIICLVTTTLFATGCGKPNSPTEAKTAEEFEEAPPGGDFTLMSDKGPVATQDFRGKVLMLYFGYTQCPDVCPTSMLIMSQSLNALSKQELSEVQPVFVSVDPERDKVEKLAEYVQYFHPSFIGITGSEKEVADVSRMYGNKYYEVKLEDSGIDYSVNHSAAIYLIDDQGTLRFIFPHKTPSATVTESIQHILKEKVEEAAAKESGQTF